VAKMIDETIAYPNVIYEIENEHQGGNEPAWQTHYSQFVKDYIAANYPGSPRLVSNSGDPSADFSVSTIDIVNMHNDSGTNPSWYNSKLESNWYRNKAMNIDEFANHVADYNALRKVCWTIVTSGGNFKIEDAESSAKPYDIAKNILLFISKSGWDFPHAAPNKGLIAADGGYCMANPGVEYVCYFPSGGEKSVKLPAGKYTSKWWNPRSGGFSGQATFTHSEGDKSFKTPDGSDWVLRIKSLAKQGR